MTTTAARRLLVIVTALTMALAVVLTFARPGPADAATSTSTGADSPAAPYAAFVRDWVGHTRSLHVRADHIARESAYSGCCERGADVKFRVSKARGTTKHGSLRAVVLKVKYWDTELAGPRPHRGDRVRWTVRHGVLFEPVVGTNYCTNAASRRGVCGA